MTFPVSYPYNTLDTSTQEIRLLILQPSSSLEAPVTATLRTVSLFSDPKPTYEAISYVWGDPTATRFITLDGIEVPITVNLESALRHFRLGTENRAMWADAICINQADDAEKGVQVGFMGDIYTNCTKCLAWLGEDVDGEGHRAFELLEATAASKDLQDIFRECKAATDHKMTKFCSLDKLMQRPYWTRLWVVQEALLPLEVDYCCGRSIISQKVFLNAKHRLGFHLSESVVMCESCCDGLKAFFSEPVSKIFKFNADSATETTEPREIPALLLISNNLICQNPLDRIYAVRALLLPRIQSAIVVDYQNMTLKRLYTQMLLIDTQESGLLRLLGRVGHDYGQHLVDCPSWLSRHEWASRSTSLERFSLTRLYQGDGFSPSRSVRAELHTDRIKDGVLGTSSIYFSIVDVNQAKYEGELEREGCESWLDLVKAHPRLGGGRPTARAFPTQGDVSVFWMDLISSVSYSGGGTIGNAFWRTMLLDSGENTTDRRIHRANASDGPIFWDMWTTLVSGENDPDEIQERNEKMLSVGLIFMRSVLNRSFFITQTGYMGIGPPTIQSGDEIHIIAGGQWPMVLRKETLSAAEYPHPTYTFIGECYVHGIMDGEAAENFEERARRIDLI